MPIYEYICKKCGERFEALVSASRKPVCPSCNSKSLQKLVSSFSAPTTSSSGRRSRLSSCCGGGECGTHGGGCGCGCNGGCHHKH